MATRNAFNRLGTHLTIKCVSNKKYSAVSGSRITEGEKNAKSNAGLGNHAFASEYA
jgi:hypothetical protein